MKSIPSLFFSLVTFSVAAFDMARLLQRGDPHRGRRGYNPHHCRQDRLPPRRCVAENFDFSSTAGWEAYYQTQQVSESVMEWHSSVPMEMLASLVPSNATSVVLVGCGSSFLPEFIQRHRPRASLILQDSSETCLQMLRERYGSNMSYVCGDATKLSECIENLDAADNNHVDVIYDKGLMDAIFCNEGWNKPIQLLVEEASKVLVEGGIYILVSYRLPKPTKEFLQGVGTANNLEWSFDLEGSNDRVGISVATKRASVRP